MKKQLKHKITLMLALFFFSTKLTAQDTLSFTWLVQDGEYVEEGYMNGFQFKATINEPFTINWGDGNVETKICESDTFTIALTHYYDTIGEYTITMIANDTNCKFLSFDSEGNKIHSLDITKCSALTNLICNYNTLTSLAICPSLISSECSRNQLTNLDLSNGSSLVALYCHGNQLTSLNLTECPVLERLNCDDNQLQLSDLYSAHLLIADPTSKKLGVQNQLPQTAIVGEKLFSEQSVFSGVFTDYIVTKNGNLAPEDNYSLEDGTISFNLTGDYVVTMTNKSIVSHENYPAAVIIPINVSTVDVRENDLSNIKIYPNPTNGELRVEYYESEIETIEIFDTHGKKHYSSDSSLVFPSIITLDISHLPAGVYFLKFNKNIFKVIVAR
ncbi:T9SS type A sorting domain-containing protein [Bacteroidales bacterium OttesenSCG-928-C03]|nr:T9SS type A sorting domain-containing protein [Bacteroidales bacterium OttesenSCG-928-C03]